MTPSPPQERIPTLREALRQFLRLVRLIRPYWGDLSKGIVLALVLGLMGMIPPLFTKLLFDEVYPSDNVSLMHVLVGAILAFTLASTLLGLVRSIFSLYVSSRLNSATRLFFFNHLQHLRLGFFDRHRVGEITSRFQDVGRALESIHRVFQTIFVQGIYLLLVPPILFVLEWRLALVALVSLPLSVLATALSGPVLRRSFKRSSEAYADLSAFQVEALSNIRTFKTMGLEPYVYGRAKDLVEHAMGQQQRAGRQAQSFGALNGLLRGLNMALFTWLGWTLILSRQMTLGEFLAFSAYLAYLFNPLSQLVELFSDFQQSAVHLDRMFEYLDEPPEQDPARVYEAPRPIRQRLRGELSLEGVSFSYVAGQKVLCSLDARFEEGSVTALVGASGSGKTSLLRLLAGLERPQEGVVRADGSSLTVLPLHELRQQLAVVWQEVSLVQGTLWQNLTLGGLDADRPEVDRICRLCGLESVLRALPQGYETPVAEWGSSLSAGQRQRVALARALLRKAPILLLDEATANIDVATEMEILRGMFQELRGRTVIFATHRLATAALADQVCVLVEGRLEGFGGHEDLLDSCPAYRQMHGAASPPRLVSVAAAGSKEG